ncbi:alpha/beta hydrolase fold domain-containing protein [Conexibacter woesei]|uniref:Alpha/beta hydrolase fold-3 domain protein n=1 Tax=Conexibacter woesei (strain DSM 14684 / CCUG 47730 / CIP 108061 / JCM 11494 / NBRC 100937 / ID131577) TaxID=469383 RepID=D3FEM1_CONWI|nr:alpha/beta hydrolase fold domain-containing protein [Conexibacter woesei]ADB49695.1 Alpha/beta hydrolase fold-3 domain protein [Conexibacter woesei DSM 14684]
MPIAPEIARVVDLLEAEASAAGKPSLEQMRADHEANTARFTPLRARASVASIHTREIPGPDGPVPVRIYRPHRRVAGTCPTMLWFHGGGWMTGSLETADIAARELCAADMVVVSVQYRLAPESPFPAGLEDGLVALRWVCDAVDELGGDADRIAVGGDSAGGNLAAVLALMARDLGVDVAAQLLLYPLVDADAGTAYRSRVDQADGPLLRTAEIEWIITQYLRPGSDPRDPHVSPIHASDHAGLAPAVIVTVEFDPLRDEAEAYADALTAAGVQVTKRRVPGLVHGCFDMIGVSPTARDAIDDAIADLLRHLRTGDVPRDDEPSRSPDDTSHSGVFFARFVHPERYPLIARSPLPAADVRRLAGGLVGLDEEAYGSAANRFASSAATAAVELLDDADFAAAVRRLPFRTGDRVLALGDSITDDACSWAEILRAVLQATQAGAEIVNAGIVGDTTTDAIGRADLLVAARPTWVIQLLGSNDVRRHGHAAQVRMLTLGETLRNFRAIEQLIAEDARARLIRMTPTPVRDDQSRAWEHFAVHGLSWRSADVAEVARELLRLDADAVDLHTALSGPGIENWLLPDGVHPTVAGQQQILRALVHHLAERDSPTGPPATRDAGPGDRTSATAGS